MRGGVYDQISSNKIRSAALVAVFVLLVLAVGWAFGMLTDWGTGVLFSRSSCHLLWPGARTGTPTGSCCP
jgi:hypothetical protein